MGLEALLSSLETRRADTRDTPCNLTGVSREAAPIGACTLDTPDTPEIIDGKGIATVSRWWRLHFPDREPLEVACFPDSTHDEILERNPAAIAAEPFEPATSTAGRQMALDPELEARIRAMAKRWEYSGDDLRRALDGARSDPEGWRRVVDSDEGGRKAMEYQGGLSGDEAKPKRGWRQKY